MPHALLAPDRNCHTASASAIVGPSVRAAHALLLSWDKQTPIFATAHALE